MFPTLSIQHRAAGTVGFVPLADSGIRDVNWQRDGAKGELRYSRYSRLWDPSSIFRALDSEINARGALAVLATLGASSIGQGKTHAEQVKANGQGQKY